MATAEICSHAPHLRILSPRPVAVVTIRSYSYLYLCPFASFNRQRQKKHENK